MSEAEPYSVVVADDVTSLRKLVRFALEDSGRFRVAAEAATGVEAVQRAKEHRPDLVLLDLSMPEMDGLEALPHVLRASPNSRVVVFSGFNHSRMEPVALRQGASAYLEKGLDPEEIIDALLGVVEDGREPDPPGALVPPETAPEEAETGTAPASRPSDLRHLYRALVVTGDDALAEAIGSSLTPKPGVAFEVTRMASVEEAGGVLGSEAIDVVILDPDAGSGTREENLTEMLAHVGNHPVVALVPGDGTGMERIAVRLGVEDCIPRDRLDPEVVRRATLFSIERRSAYHSRITARDQARKIEHLKELERLKGQFFNMAAHELWTPLTPIKLQLHLLKNVSSAGMSPQQQKSLDILDRNVERLVSLTQDLLEIARLQAGKLRLEPQNVDLGGIIHRVVESFEPVALQRSVSLEMSIPEPVTARADEARLTQVLFNLLSNALKFTPAGGRVNVFYDERPEEHAITVEDSGLGLERAQIDGLFEPFSQMHPYGEYARLGTGLGLYVCRGIVELHGGRIWAESDGPGKGSRFTFTLPKTPKASDIPRGALAASAEDVAVM